MSPDRIKAGMIWWTNGFVEYQFPNYLEAKDNLEMLDLSMELDLNFHFPTMFGHPTLRFILTMLKLARGQARGIFRIHGGNTPLPGSRQRQPIRPAKSCSGD